MSDPSPRLDPEALLAHASMLRRLARGLLFDPHAADDVVQETWLAALQGGPARGTSLRAWLASVARHLSFDVRRARHRRERREQAAARPETVPSAAAVAERLEIVRRLADAIESLDEPYRATVMLRYLDGLPPRVVAQRMQVPVATVHTRVRRALADLRLRLDRAHGGDRERWCHALWPLATARAGILSTLGGVAIMGAKAKVVAAAIAVLVLVGASLVFVARPGGEKTQRPVDGAAAAASGSLPRRDVEVAAAESSGVTGVARSNLAASATWIVRGTALRGYGVPFPHAHVRARVYAGYETDGEPLVERLLEADDAGVLTWALDPPAGTVTLWLRGEESRHFTFRRTALVVRGGDAPQSLEVMLFPIDCHIVGTVTDEERRPLAGAIVSDRGQPKRSVTCDAAGRYVLETSSAYTFMFLDASASGFAVTGASTPLGGPGCEPTCDFRLPSEMRVIGRVTDAAGAPIEGARVSASGLYEHDAVTDADGAYVVDRLDPRREVQFLQVRCDGYGSSSVQVRTSGRETRQDFVLERGGRVAGTVVDPEGHPVAGASVILGHMRNEVNALEAISRDQGEFAFACAPPGTHKLTAQARGFAPDVRMITVPPGGELASIQIQLVRGHTLAGTVRNRAGEPVAGAHVSFRLGNNFLDSEARTGSDGRFRADGLPDGTLDVDVLTDRYVYLRQTGVAVDQDDLALVVDRAGEIAGRVIDAATQQPISRFRVRFVEASIGEGERKGYGYEANWSQPGYQFTDPDGVWRTHDRLDPALVYGVEVTAEGYAPATNLHVRAAVDPDPQALVIALHAGSLLTGEVLDDETDDPVAGVSVKLFRGAPPIRLDGFEANGRSAVTTDADGRFTFTNVATGEATLVLQHPDFALALDGPFTSPDGEHSVRLGRGGRIAGLVLDAEDHPLPGATVWMSGEEAQLGRTERTVTTDASGAFAFEHLRPAKYWVAHRVTAGSNSLYASGLGATIAGSETITLRLGGAQGTASIAGTLEFEGGVPELMTVSLLAWPLGSRQDIGQHAVLARGGRFEFKNLAAGEYTLTIYHWDEARQITLGGGGNVKLAEGQARRVTIQLVKAKGF